MALRNQPYLPLYVQDFLTDEKLMECSASATGIYIRVMCIMHKSDEYGTILLKQKDKQSDKQILNFAYKLAKFLPWDLQTVVGGLEELLAENVISIEGDLLIQKRMKKDGLISDKRALAGSKGGNKSLGKPIKQPKKFAQAKSQANSESEIDNENEDESKNEVVVAITKNAKPDFEEIVSIFNQVCFNLPQAQKLNEQRKAAINSRIKEHGLETIGKAFKMVADSDFLNGNNSNQWKASFDWIFKPANFNKIIEGNYGNRTSNTAKSTTTTKQSANDAVDAMFGVAGRG